MDTTEGLKDSMNVKQTRKNSEPNGPRRLFDEAFKRRAVALIESGRAVAQLSRELDVSPFSLYEWKRKFGQPVKVTAPAPSNVAELQEENRSLKAEVERLRQREEILKKTLGILSEPGTSASSGSRR
jgi:transposase